MWSFLQVNQNLKLPQQHVIIQDVSEKEALPVDSSFFKKYIKNEPYTIYFDSHIRHTMKKKQTDNDLKEKLTISIPDFFQEMLKSIPTSSQENLKIETFQTSIEHFQYFSQHRFSRYISYNDFCQLEYTLSKIVQEYLKDEKRSYVIYLDDIFIRPMGVRKYWKGPKNFIYICRENFSDGSVDFVIVKDFENTNFL